MNEKGMQREVACRCPYCDGEIKTDSESPAICQPCSITIVNCESCGEPMRKGAESSHECKQAGAD